MSLELAIALLHALEAGIYLKVSLCQSTSLAVDNCLRLWWEIAWIHLRLSGLIEKEIDLVDRLYRRRFAMPSTSPKQADNL
jgi:hypothetical protein